ncbi:MAG: TIGR01777 family oxidoreductase [Myxococcales bacterium]|nr:TIGR01777 family oxidoreductase [Myxococcales bacterium]
MRVFVTGASGFVGRRLIRELLRRGDSVVALTRRTSNLGGVLGDPPQSERFTVVEGDPCKPGQWQQALAGCDAVVALAGEPVMGGRWTTEFKRRLYDSRIESVRRVVEALPPQSTKETPGPRVLISASAVGYYGSRGTQELTESAGPGSDFLANLCADWEAAAEAAKQVGARVVCLRIGVVLGEGGGALEKMLPAFRLFMGGPMGSGEQYWAWIHLEDVVGLILYSLSHAEVQGPVNAVAPGACTVREIAKQIGATLHRPAMFAVPELALKVLLGDRAEVLLASQRVVPQRARELGYRFRYEDLPTALRAALGQPHS